MPYSHGAIIEQMLKFGYEDVSGGVCNGVNMMGVQAILVHEEDKYIARVNRICETPDLLEQVQASREKVKMKKPLTKQDEDNLEIPAFFDGVILYLNPSRYQEIFGRRLTSFRGAEISEYVLPQKFAKDEKQPNTTHKMVAAHVDAFIGNKEQLKMMFRQFKKLIQKFQTDEHPLPIHMACFNHAAHIRYDAKKDCWRVSNTNFDAIVKNADIQEVKEVKETVKNKVLRTHKDELDEKLLAHYIMMGFSENNITAFCFAVMATTANPNLEKIQKAFASWRKGRPITEEQMSMESDLGNTLHSMAAGMGITEFLTHLPKAANPKFPLVPMPQIAAAREGRLNVLQEIKRQGVDLNKALEDGQTIAIHAAVGTPNVNFIPQLHDLGVGFDTNVNTKFVGGSPLDAAISQKNWPGVVAILFAKENFKFGKMYQIERGHLEQAFIQFFTENPTVKNLNREGVKRLAYFGINFNLGVFEHKSCLSVLIDLKRWDVVMHVLANMKNLHETKAPLVKTLQQNIGVIYQELKKYLDSEASVSPDDFMKNSALSALFQADPMMKNIVALTIVEPHKLRVASDAKSESKEFGVLNHVHLQDIVDMAVPMLMCLSVFTMKKAGKDQGLLGKFFAKDTSKEDGEVVIKQVGKLPQILLDKDKSIAAKQVVYRDALTAIEKYLNHLTQEEMTGFVKEKASDHLVKCIMHLVGPQFNGKLTSDDIKNNLKMYLNIGIANLNEDRILKNRITPQ